MPRRRAYVAVENVGRGLHGRIVGPFETMKIAEKWIELQPSEDFGGQTVVWHIQSLDAPETGAVEIGPRGGQGRGIKKVTAEGAHCGRCGQPYDDGSSHGPGHCLRLVVSDAC